MKKQIIEPGSSYRTVDGDTVKVESSCDGGMFYAWWMPLKYSESYSGGMDNVTLIDGDGLTYFDKKPFIREKITENAFDDEVTRIVGLGVPFAQANRLAEQNGLKRD